MTCIHGLDETNCYTCRIIRSSVPLKGIRLKKLNFLKSNNFISKKNIDLGKKMTDELISKKTSLNPPNLISKPPFINEMPTFKDKLFLERLKELNIAKEDTYGITKKIPLEKPEWQFEKEE
ncbi:MAG: hypothetical protein ACFE9Q_03440 [Candidatus Hodarchaeota archaeon]